MTLHSAVRPRDRRWHLTFLPDDTDRHGSYYAVDDHGQRWKNTRHRRWTSQQWICGHEGEQVIYIEQDYLGRERTNVWRHAGHGRFWERISKRRGLTSPDKLCEMTGTLSPTNPRATVTPRNTIAA